MDVYTSPLRPPKHAGFIKTMLEKCHHFTLTDALVTVQTINLLVPGSQLKKIDEWKRYSLSPGVWQSFVTIRSCNHLMRIISTYVDNTKKSEIS